MYIWTIFGQLAQKGVWFSAAKCHEYHEIFTNENNEHIRGSLMFIADTQ